MQVKQEFAASEAAVKPDPEQQQHHDEDLSDSDDSEDEDEFEVRLQPAISHLFYNIASNRFMPTIYLIYLSSALW